MTKQRICGKQPLETTGRSGKKSQNFWGLKLAPGKGLSQESPKKNFFWWNVRDLLNMVLN
ncbi:hypothetical protein [[Phormidium] sp. ETS-05]|uniref:hypothetical protein n=1 Tax=[Phormidium] sp. ETS-05 TaxID=222819 RepID=UPI0018EF1F92|nr:hypothetical protein [[Phormidium] sp. ETS-05]